MTLQQPWCCWPRRFQGWREPTGLRARRRLCLYPAEDSVLFADMVQEGFLGRALGYACYIPCFTAAFVLEKIARAFFIEK